MKDKIIPLLQAGYTYNQICQKVKCAKSAISYHAKRLGLGKPNTSNYDWKQISDYQKSGHTRQECRIKFNISSSAWHNALKRGDVLSSKKSILVLASRKVQGYAIKRAFLKTGVANKCAICGYSTWMDKPIPLQIDHINGNRLDNRVGNLRLLCGTCHTQTETFGQKTKYRYKK